MLHWLPGKQFWCVIGLFYLKPVLYWHPQFPLKLLSLGVVFQNPIQDPAFSSYLSCLLDSLWLWQFPRLVRFCDDLDSFGAVLVRQFVDCLSVWVCLISFFSFFFLGYTAVSVLRRPQWWHVILGVSKGPAVSRICHLWCWPWGPRWRWCKKWGNI